ncbi:MAG: hypothetical protein JRI26_02565, partial [Deltaproteobacteria bacterium]|nr:hypothetical protein [Deltaproteobacteria bacterium]
PFKVEKGSGFRVICLFLIFPIGWEALDKITTAKVGESGMSIHIIQRYVRYAWFRFLVNLEPLNHEP